MRGRGDFSSRTHFRPSSRGSRWCAEIVAQAAPLLGGLDLGDRWNTRIIVIPTAAPVTGGPYRFMRHPNYLAVVIEIAAVPMIGGAIFTAIVFSIANALDARGPNSRRRARDSAGTTPRRSARAAASFRTSGINADTDATTIAIIGDVFRTLPCSSTRSFSSSSSRSFSSCVEIHVISYAFQRSACRPSSRSPRCSLSLARQLHQYSHHAHCGGNRRIRQRWFGNFGVALPRADPLPDRLDDCRGQCRRCDRADTHFALCADAICRSDRVPR